MFLLQLKSRLIAGQKWGFKSAQPGQVKSSLGASTCCLFGCRQACVLVLLPHGMQHLLAAWPKVQKAEGRRRALESSGPEDLQQQPPPLYLLALTGSTKLFCLN